MADRRVTPSNGRVAARHLEGRVPADRFVDGVWHRVSSALAPLYTEPGGAIDRQLLFGRAFCVLEEVDGFAYGYAEDDGYCGYVMTHSLWVEAPAPTHWISARQTYGKAVGDLKSPLPEIPYFFGATVHVLERAEKWSAIATPLGAMWLPNQHLTPMDQKAEGVVANARLFLGAPYLWAGNSSAGIDCSGLVQLALWAAGIPCPGDSDLQAALGEEIPENAPLQASDLIFWKGHVGMMTGPDTIIHANAHHMAVVEEPLPPTIARIEAAGDGPVTARRRIKP